MDSTTKNSFEMDKTSDKTLRQQKAEYMKRRTKQDISSVSENISLSLEEKLDTAIAEIEHIEAERLKFFDRNVQLSDENVQITDLNTQLIAENEQLNSMMSEVIADLKITKNSIIGFMQEMKLLDENLDMKESPNYASVSMSIISIARGKGKASDQFKSLQNLFPLIEKYKNL